MEILPLNKLGSREKSAGLIEFGFYLPWVSAADGNRIWVKIIHEKDQFIQDIQPIEIELNHSYDTEFGDYWSGEIDINQIPISNSKSAWGSPGKYIYRYCLKNPTVSEMIDWIVDPFAREFGVGKLSSITVGYEDYTWSKYEEEWKTPKLNDLVIYELMISEFGKDINGSIKLLDYLADLGINCIEVMPVSNVSFVVDWGYLPIGYFGVDDRFGNRKEFQWFVDEAHQRNIAVIIDAVYGHTSEHFPYFYVYDRLGYHENPIMGSFSKDMFGKSTDFERKYTQDFFFTVNYYWLDRYHIDGFRYDCVPNYWDGPIGNGYANLTYHTFQSVKGKKGLIDHWQRFFDKDGGINLIQCAEQLEAPVEILEKSYSNCTWQNQTLDSAKEVASGNKDCIADFGLKLGLYNYPNDVTVNEDSLKKSVLQYIENHDHSRFVCNFRTIMNDMDFMNEIFKEGDRSLWFKVQPYLIGILTSKGIPLLWQGQEFGENYWLPYQGIGRVLLFRPVRWDYFYDSIGKKVIALVRKLLNLRKERSQLRYGEHYFYNHYENYQSRSVLIFSRQYNNNFSLIALNFSDQEHTIPYCFPLNGNYKEELHEIENLYGIVENSVQWLKIPSNYGRIWTLMP